MCPFDDVIMTHRTPWDQDKMATIFADDILKLFSAVKLLYFDSYFIKMCSLGSSWAINCSDNGLTPNRRQAIIWTNDGLRGLNEYVYAK